MKSMTGYGKGEACSALRKVTIEVKSVNNRYLDITMRLPRSLAFVEDSVKKLIQSRLSRGSVDVFFTYDYLGDSGKIVSLDKSLALGYINAARSINSEYGLENDLAASDLLKVPDMVKITSAAEDTEEVTALFLEAASNALDALDSMRLVEGANAKSDFTTILNNIASTLDKVIAFAPSVVSSYKEKLIKRIGELLGNVPVDESRIAMEVALFADKCDINEEINRLGSHISQFRLNLESNEPIGRKLDFLSQEMNREINTMGSKANDIELAGHVIYMKNELEKIKEQIRNIE